MYLEYYFFFFFALKDPILYQNAFQIFTVLWTSFIQEPLNS